MQLLAAGYPAVKAADPSATVVMGGLSTNDYNYLAGVYGAGGKTYFDAVAVHPYTDVDPTDCWQGAGTSKPAMDAFCGIEEVRDVMVANGDSAKSIWLTEFGWSTTTGDYGVSESQQADFLTKALTKVESYPYVKAAFWYDFRDTWSDPTDYEANLGLLRSDFATRPSYNAMRSYTGVATESDTRAPVIASVRTSNIKRTSVTVNWLTDEDADTRVEYWVGSATHRTVSSSTLTTLHAIPLSGLARRTRYSYQVRSADAAGNIAVSDVHAFSTAR